MVSLQDLTVSQVSSVIAAAVFVVQFLIPIVLPIILLGLLCPRSTTVTETAVSWSVIGKISAFVAMASHPSNRLGLDHIGVQISAVVTPLGLYEGIVAEPTTDVEEFHYVRDTTPMGYGTPPRGNTTWSRLCGAFLLIPCPNDNKHAAVIDNRTMTFVVYTEDWYDTRVPQKIVDVFQSGADDLGASVSSSFDIQWRSYIKSTIDDVKKKNSGSVIENGTARTVGTYQPLSSLVLSDDLLAVEGLVVDMKNGGIGFRNHSAPNWREYGSAWTEDILFVVPDTVWVDTNLTVDFQVARTRSDDLLARNGNFKPEIMDHGGFVNLNKT
ncbi:hypothetical protein EK21DRAFT_118926 [Setomelanomma holmii]|uniref:Uncharacterized protein n=1 Tax=Setomelanomma holmii TaxID=210430 RepID=A0A9P4GWP8_9PLEO|nr:hypothetical protein EK21DRAFT_118926 [Setomelanomma holmii]